MRGLVQECKRFVKHGLIASRAMKLGQVFRSRRIAILRYHSIQENLADCPCLGGIAHQRSLFERQIEMITRRYTPIPFGELSAYLVGDRPIPPRAVSITFDDGYADNYELALPILEKYGVQAVFYVTTGLIGQRHALPWFCRLSNAFASTRQRHWTDRVGSVKYDLHDAHSRARASKVAARRIAGKTGEEQNCAILGLEVDLAVTPFSPTSRLMMTWDEVRRMRERGQIIGGHTVSHPNLTLLDDEQLQREVVDAKAQLERQLGTTVLHSSYPNPFAIQPHWTDAVIAAVRNAGYQTAATSTAGAVRRADNMFSLKRTYVPSDLRELSWVLECTLLGRAM